MVDNEFNEKVRERAYFKYLDRIRNGICGDAYKDWVEAAREVMIEIKIEQEAFMHYLKNGDYPVLNWITAEREVMYRLRFLAYYMHEADIDKSPVENWVNAQELYIEKF